MALVTDDAGVSRSTLTLEFRKAVEEQGLDYRTLKRMVRNSIEYSFADEATRSTSGGRPRSRVPRVRSAAHRSRSIKLGGHMRALLVIAMFVATQVVPAPQAPNGSPSRTQVVLLGTGSPPADPLRSGPATAIVVNDTAYLVDLGPGIVRRAAAAAEKGIPSLAPNRLRTAFVTHLHSDHTVGYPDLIFSTWVLGRRTALQVYGPAGITLMTGHLMQAWQADIDIRTRGLEHRSTTGLDVEAHDITAGVVYQDANVKVTAFPNAHGEWAATFGYRFDTADRSIVISGDTNPSDALVRQCQKCDVLIHEAYADEYRPVDMANWLEYRSKYHTTTSQLAEIAAKTNPGLADHPPSRRRCPRPGDSRGALHRGSPSGVRRQGRRRPRSGRVLRPANTSRVE